MPEKGNGNLADCVRCTGYHHGIDDVQGYWHCLYSWGNQRFAVWYWIFIPIKKVKMIGEIKL